MASPRPPRYVVIENDLRERLTHARPGDPLPSETELSTRFGVSRMTARQAVKSLEAEGLLYRIPGSGTFASGGAAHRTMGVLRSFTDELQRRGATVSSRVLAAEWFEPAPEVLADLALQPGSRAVRVRRVRLADGEPLAIETVALPPRCSFVLGHDLAAGSLHRLLTDRGIEPTEAVGTLVATGADADDARHLDIDVGVPLMVERRRIVDQHGERVESTETRYVGSKYVFDVHLRKE
jgi:GntR family transcriptional regulator